MLFRVHLMVVLSERLRCMVIIDDALIPIIDKSIAIAMLS